MTDRSDDFELVRGSGNVFRDLGRPDADVRQTKAILAVRIRNAQLGRFTIDRLMTVLNKLGQQVEVPVSLHPRPTPSDTRPATPGD